MKKTEMDGLIGKIIEKIFISDTYICFVTNKGILNFDVYGDCCSTSYFSEFVGVENLLKGTEVKSVEEIPEKDCDGFYDEFGILYGFRIVTEDQYGERSAVISFRNDSNGYYGGCLRKSSDDLPIPIESEEIKSDWAWKIK